jgi:hypothetical protein
MPKFLYQDIVAALSLDREPAVNTPFDESADFVGVRMNVTTPPTPELEFIDDSDQVGTGDGDEGGDDQRAGYWQPRRIPVGGKLNTELAGRLLLRGAGGAVTTTVVTASQSWDSVAKMQTKDEGRTPVLSTLVTDLAAGFMWPSMAVGSFFINSSGQDPVTFESELINPARWRKLTDFPSLVIPEPEDYFFMHPAGVSATYNDGIARDFAADGRLISTRVGFTNNIVVQGLPGDGFHTANTPSSGAYAREMHRTRRAHEATIQIYQDTGYNELDTLIANLDVTSLVFKYRGDKINSTDYREVEVKAPLCKLRGITAGTFNDFATWNLNFRVRRDPVSGSRFVNRVRHAAGLTYK